MHHFLLTTSYREIHRRMPAHGSPTSDEADFPHHPSTCHVHLHSATSSKRSETLQSALTGGPRPQVQKLRQSVLTGGPRPQVLLPSIPKHTRVVFTQEGPPSTHIDPIAGLGDTGTHRTHHHKNKQARDLYPPHTAPAREKEGPEPRTVAASA